MTHKDSVLILDAENCPKLSKEHLFTGLKNKNCKHIILVYAKSPINLNLDEVSVLNKHIASGKVTIYKMKNEGKNSADFGLTFFAGRLSSQFKQHEVVFEVVSNDKDLEYLITLLKHFHFQATRISSTAQPPVAISPKTNGRTKPTTVVPKTELNTKNLRI